MKPAIKYTCSRQHLHIPAQWLTRVNLKIKLNDLIFVPHEIGEVYETTIFLNRFMAKNDLKSAILFLPYYETEKFQFYFRRFLSPELTIQVKPLEARYKHFLEQWISNTGLSNIYLDQYLIIAHYYFNKILWTHSKGNIL